MADETTHNRRMYDAICAVLEKRATTDQNAYSYEGRNLTRIPIFELQKLKAHYKRLLLAETRRKNGYQRPRFVMRFK